MGSKSVLLRTLVTALSAETADFGVVSLFAEVACPTPLESLTTEFGG
jgi:hypothetical protein